MFIAYDAIFGFESFLTCALATNTSIIYAINLGNPSLFVSFHEFVGSTFYPFFNEIKVIFHLGPNVIMICS